MPRDTQRQDIAERPASFTDQQWLGKQLFFDRNLSRPPGQPCAGCHVPAAGWAGVDAQMRDYATNEAMKTGLKGYTDLYQTGTRELLQTA